MGVIEFTLRLGGKKNGIPYPAKLAEKATSNAITGCDASVPSIRPKSIIFSEFPLGRVLFNDFMSCNRVVGHRHSSWVNWKLNIPARNSKFPWYLKGVSLASGA